MGSAVSAPAPYASEEEALAAGKTQDEIDAWKTQHLVAANRESKSSRPSHIRELTAVEASFAMPWHRVGTADEGKVLPMNVVIGCRCTVAEDKATPEKLQAAVAAVAARHPLLGCSIRRTEDGSDSANASSSQEEASDQGQSERQQPLGALALFADATPVQVEIRQIPLQDGGDAVNATDIIERLNEECLCWIDTRPRAPLARVIAAQDTSDPTQFCFFFCTTHVMFDGRSTQIFASEFLALIAEPAAELAATDGSLEHLTFRQMLQAEGVTPADGFMDYVGPLMPHMGQRGHIQGDHAAFDAQTSTGCKMITLDSAETAALVAEAKTRGVTVNTVALTAWCRVVSTYAPWAVEGATHQIGGLPIDARRVLGPKFANTMSQIFGGSFLALPLDASLAEQQAHVDATVKLFVEKRWHVGSFSREKGPKDAAQRWATLPLNELITSFPKATASFSNLGRLRFDIPGDVVTVQRAWLAGGAYPDISLICHAATIAGVCTFCIQYVKPAHSVEGADQLAAAFRAELLGHSD